MDPISGAILAGGSLLGGLLNTSSQQAINQQQLQFAQQQSQVQQAQWLAAQTGANLPALDQHIVAAAKSAGINPLAMLGQTGGSAGSVVSAPSLTATRPGDAIENAVRQISQIKTPDPQAARLKELDVVSRELEVQNQALRNRQLVKEISGKSEPSAGWLHGIMGTKEKLAFPLDILEQSGGLLKGAIDRGWPSVGKVLSRGPVGVGSWNEDVSPRRVIMDMP